MSMTKVDYELIAGVINERRENTWNLDKLGWTGNEITAGIAVIDDLVIFMVNRLAKDNPKFDREKFLRACGVTE